MSKILNLSKKDADRVFVTGKLLGDSSRFMRYLYEQQFNYKDILVVCGDVIDINSTGDSVTLLEFMKANENCYAVMGDQEAKYIKYTDDENLKTKVHYQLLDQVEKTYKDYIKEMPPIIKITEDTYVVHAGVNPLEGSKTKDEETFYEIGNYDSNSRFYQFVNPEKKNWYDFKIFDGDKQVKIVFCAIETPQIEVPAGYSLYRSADAPLRCMIFTQEANPTIIEVK